ncbi:MAG TPA: AI-2E family transporter [Candidatus Limnocylindrales bacterium]
MRADAFRWFTRGAALTLGAAIAVALIYVLLLGMPVVILVFIALLLASALEPLIDSIRTRTPLRRGATLLLVYLIFFLGLAALVLLVVPGAINQFSDIGARATPLLANAHDWAETVEPKPVSVALIGLIDSFQKAIQPSAVQAPPPDQLLQLGFTAAEAVISIVSVLTMVYFWLTERARLQRFALALIPATRRGGAREAWNQIELRLGGWVRGELILMGFVGVATTIAYFLIGLQGPLLLGLIAALCELIPLVGPAIGAIPALVVAALTGQPETVLLVAGVYFAIQLIEGNVLVPLVMHNTIGVPPLLVFVGILAGGVIGGIPGALFAVPLITMILVVMERLQARESPVPLSPEKPPSEVEDLVGDEAPTLS